MIGVDIIVAGVIVCGLIMFASCGIDNSKRNG